MDQDAILDAFTATDGVAIETVQAADERSFVVEGRLWLLDGRNSWAVPYRAAITLAEGVDAVESYRITVGQPLAPRTDHAGRQTPVDAYEWLVVDDKGRRDVPVGRVERPAIGNG